jgi:hypothetical protein
MRTKSYLSDEHASRLQERAFSVTLSQGGLEIRPTRVFLWTGSRGSGRQWVYSLGLEPRLLRLPRRRRHVQSGRLSVSYLGNPLVTLALFAGRFVRRRSAAGKASGSSVRF